MWPFTLETMLLRCFRLVAASNPAAGITADVRLFRPRLPLTVFLGFRLNEPNRDLLLVIDGVKSNQTFFVIVLQTSVYHSLLTHSFVN